MAGDTLPLSLSGGQASEPKRRCRECGEAKALSDFERLEYGRRRVRCKACANARHRKRYNEDPAAKAYLDNWNKANPDKRRAYSKAHYDRSRKVFISWISKAVTGIRSKCKHLGLQCTITRQDVVDLFDAQGGLCALTARPMLWGATIAEEENGYRFKGGPHRDSVSIDRIFPAAGYVVGNVRLVTYQANFARNRFSDDELFAFCEAVLATRGALQ